TGSMVTTKSTPLAASPIEAARLAPDCTTKFTASSLRSKTLRVWPALIKLRAIGAPMLPTPMNPTRAMMLLLTPPARARGRRCRWAMPDGGIIPDVRSSAQPRVEPHLRPLPGIDHQRCPMRPVASPGWARALQRTALVRRGVEVYRHVLPLREAVEHAFEREF